MSTESDARLPIATDYGAFHLDWLLMQLEVDPKEYLDQERFRSFKSSATDVNKVGPAPCDCESTWGTFQRVPQPLERAR